MQSFRWSWAQATLTVKQLFVEVSAQFAGPDSGHQASFMIECPECAWVQFWGPQSDSETGTRTREPNLVTRMGAQSSPTSDLNDWGRHCGSQNVEFLWLQNSARSAARKLVTLLLLALRKLPRKRSQKRSRKSYALLANPVPCSCPNVPAARLD